MHRNAWKTVMRPPVQKLKWKEGGQIIYCVDIKEEKGRNEKKKKILVVLLFYNQRLYP